MKSAFNADARKRAVNLTLNEDLVTRVRATTDNLSAVVEALLAGHLEEKERQRLERHRVGEAVAAHWNAVVGDAGSYADEHSPL